MWNIAAQEPDRPAVIDPDGSALTYGELAASADRIARGLQELGLAPGDAVAGLLPNGSQALALFFAAIQAGLYVVPINWHLGPNEIAYILTDSDSRAFIAHERFGGRASPPGCSQSRLTAVRRTVPAPKSTT